MGGLWVARAAGDEWIQRFIGRLKDNQFVVGLCVGRCEGSARLDIY